MAAPAAYSQMAGRIAAQLLKGLEKMKYTTMTPVQQKVLEMPDLTQDCLVQARTGTGKTIAFLLPALNTLLTKKDLPHKQVGLLVLAPTRELAQQIADECDQLTSEIHPKMECHVAVGGSNKKATLAKFMRGNPTVLVATPGRLIDYLSEEETRQKFKDVKVVVLDEADRMLDQGFQPALLQILRSIPPKATAGWQGMCFSATLPTEIHKVLHHVLKPDHVKISTIEEGGEPTVSLIPQSVVQVSSIEQVYPTLHALLAKEHDRGTPLKAIVFCSTARQAGLLYQLFGPPGNAAPDNIPVFQMQSRMAQSARTRTVEDFKAAKDGILFASDVVGRGMDFPDINLVVQVGLPADKEQYVHRVGRTGRAGKSGRAVMICIPEEMRFVRANKEFPIKIAEAPTFSGPKSSQEIIEEAFIQVPEQSKTQAYVAYLGFTKTLKRIHGMDAPAVVALANRYAAHMGCPEPPGIEAKTVGKMGLKGVPGLNIVKSGGGGGGNGRPNPNKPKANQPAAGRPAGRVPLRNDDGFGRFDPDSFDRKFFGTPAPGKRGAGNQGGRGGAGGGRGRGGAGPNKKRSNGNAE